MSTATETLFPTVLVSPVGVATGTPSQTVGQSLFQSHAGGGNNIVAYECQGLSPLSSEYNRGQTFKGDSTTILERTNSPIRTHTLTRNVLLESTTMPGLQVNVSDTQHPNAVSPREVCARTTSPIGEESAIREIQRAWTLLASLSQHERKAFLEHHNLLERGGDNHATKAAGDRIERKEQRGHEDEGFVAVAGVDNEKFSRPPSVSTDSGSKYFKSPESSPEATVRKTRGEKPKSGATKSLRKYWQSSCKGTLKKSRQSTSDGKVRGKRHAEETMSSSESESEAQVLGTWGSVRDIPKVEINRYGFPSGVFWDHMRPYVFDRGAYVFPWHIDWNKQSDTLKTRFILRMREIYAGPWEAKGVMAALGNNLRERRN